MKNTSGFPIRWSDALLPQATRKFESRWSQLTWHRGTWSQLQGAFFYPETLINWTDVFLPFERKLHLKRYLELSFRILELSFPKIGVLFGTFFSSWIDFIGAGIRNLTQPERENIAQCKKAALTFSRRPALCCSRALPWGVLLAVLLVFPFWCRKLRALEGPWSRRRRVSSRGNPRCCHVVGSAVTWKTRVFTILYFQEWDKGACKFCTKALKFFAFKIWHFYLINSKIIDHCFMFLFFHQTWVVVSNIVYVQPENWGRWTHFDSYFSDGLVQPPTGLTCLFITWSKLWWLDNWDTTLMGKSWLQLKPPTSKLIFICHIFGGFLKWWVSNKPMGFPSENDRHLGCFKPWSFALVFFDQRRSAPFEGEGWHWSCRDAKLAPRPVLGNGW